MIESLLEAIVKANGWVEKFTRYEYRAAYKTYTEVYAPLYAAAVKQSEEPMLLAEQLLQALVQYRKKLHFWERGAAQTEQKMVVVSYLTPMLLGADEPKCRELAEDLCKKWTELWPKDSYEMAGFEEIVGGFRHAILGIDLAGKHIGKNRE